LSIQEANAEHASRALQENAVDFAISAAIVPGFVSRELLGIEYVAVAHPDNPLFALKRDLVSEDLKGQCQVTISGSSDYVLAEEPKRGPHALRYWKVHSLDRAVATLGQGLAYAWLPMYRLQRWLEAGLLRVLPIQGGASRIVKLYLIHGKSVAANPSAEGFAANLRTLGARVI
jgi:DNA-binding transcriptional LysR family regulator